MTRAVQQCLAMLTAVLVLVTPTFASETADLSKSIDAAAAAFESGLQTIESDPDGSRASFREAASIYERVISQSDRPLPRIHFNRGNALLFSDDVPGAIAEFRRALQLEPDLDDARTNLEEARKRVATRIDPAPTAQAAAPITLAESVPLELRLALAILGWVLVCAALGARLLGRLTNLNPLLAIGGAATVGGGLLSAANLMAQTDPAAVLNRFATAYTGPSSTAYARAFTEPLAPGVEGTIIDSTREGWLALRLLDGRTAWVERDAVITVGDAQN